MTPAPIVAKRVADRPFSLADTLVLIAAMAVGFASIRGWDSPKWCNRGGLGVWAFNALTPAGRVVEVATVGASWAIPFALSLTVALFILRFRRPRPKSRQIIRQPGAVACFATLLAFAFQMTKTTFCWVLGYLTRPQSAIHLPSPPFMRYDDRSYHPPAGEWLRDSLLESFPPVVSPSVAVAITIAWCVLRAGGRWRPAVDWIDRAGRWLGAFWIALAVVLAILTELRKFMY